MIINLFDLDILKIMRISPIRLYVNGPPKFDTIIRNQNNLKKGIYLIKFELIKNLREWERSYIIFAPINIAELLKPCEIIVTMAPSIPHLFNKYSEIITKDICTIDEYAIITFISLLTIQ